MVIHESGPIFPGGATVWVDTDGHGTPGISFPVDEDGQIHPNPEPAPIPAPAGEGDSGEDPE